MITLKYTICVFPALVLGEGLSKTPFRRHLAIGDFDKFNEKFTDASLKLPDTEYSESVLGIPLNLGMYNMACTNFVLGDVTIDYDIVDGDTNETLAVTVNAEPFSMVCNVEYSYSFGFLLSGTSSLVATTEDNYLRAEIDLVSPDGFALEPPSSAFISYCDTKVDITNIEFQDGRDPLQGVFNTFQELIGNIIQGLAGQVACGEISKLGSAFFDDFLNTTNARIVEWLQPLPENFTDPLYTEKNYVVPDGVTLINLFSNDTVNSTIGSLFGGFLTGDNPFLGGTVDDPNSPTGQNLEINVFLRETFLEPDRSFTANLDDFGIDGTFNPVIVESDNGFAYTTVRLDSIKIFGLDTLTEFKPFVPIGDYTLSNTLAWDFLSVQVNTTINVTTTSKPDAIISTPYPVTLMENVTASLDLQNLKIVASLFMAMDEDKFNALQFGPLLKGALLCILSAMDRFEISGLDVQLQNFSMPVLSGFDIPGVGNVITKVIEAAFLAYEPTLMKAVPNIFQNTGRKVANLNGDAKNSEDRCPQLSTTSDYVDFRDLLLEPERARELGGSGKGEFGRIAYRVYQGIVEAFQRPGEDGLPQINSLFIRPFTRTQSGTEGLVRFEQELISFGGNEKERRGLLNTDFLSSIDFALNVSDIRIMNIDTIGLPLKLLDPSSQAYVVENNLNIGVDPVRLLNVSARIATSFLGLDNEIDISAALDTFGLLADISALVKTEAFVRMPLGDITNLNCWLSIMRDIELDENGFALDATVPRGLSVKNFESSLASLSLASTCLSCRSPGTNALPELFRILRESGTFTVLRDSLPSLTKSVLMSNTTQAFFDRWIDDAKKFCPSNPQYESGADRKDYGALGFPVMSAEAIDTVLYTGLVASQVGFVVLAESARQQVLETSDPLSSQNSFVPPEGVRLIDWTALGNSTGIGGIADQLFDQARAFLKGSDGNVVDFRQILGSFLDEEGEIQLITNLTLVQDGITIVIDTVRVKGLDTLTLYDVLEPLAPQTLRTAIECDTLEFDIQLTGDAPSTPEPPQTMSLSFSAEDISAVVVAFAAFDVDKLGALEIGSLLNMESLLKCVFSTANAFDIPYMNVTVASFSNPVVKGLMAHTQNASSLAIDQIYDQFKSQIIEAIPMIFNGIGKDFIASLVKSFDGEVCESASIESRASAFVDFRDLILPKEDALDLGGSGEAPYGSLVSTIYKFVQEELFAADNVTGLALLNERIVNVITETQSGVAGRLSFSGDLLNPNRILAMSVDANETGLIKFRASNLYVDNLNTIGAPLKLLEPLEGEAHQLNNDLKIGIGRALQLGMRFFFSLDVGDNVIENDLDVRVDLSALEVLLHLLAKIDEKSFISFPIRNLLNIQCWLATMPAPKMDLQGYREDSEESALAVTKFAASVSELVLNITCLDCKGGMANMAYLSSAETSKEIKEFTNGVLDALSELMEGNFLQVAADRAISDAHKKCPHSPDYDPNFTGADYQSPEESESIADFFSTFAIALAVLVVVILAIILTTKVFVRRRHGKWIASLPQRQVNKIWRQQNEEEEKNKRVNVDTTSFFRSEQVPRWLRYFMPLVILGNIGFFLSGHLSLGASVSVVASFAGETAVINNFFEFSMAKGTVQMWQAGARELALLIFLVSFAWPYTKQVVTLFLWFAPPSSVSAETRGSILLWFDTLAKWSIADIFVLIVTIVCFRISITSPSGGLFPDDFYSIDLLVVPKWGLYANMTAQLISQISSHFIVHYHRRIIFSANPELCPSHSKVNSADVQQIYKGEDVESSLCLHNLNAHAFRRPHRGESDKLVARSFVGPSLLFLSATFSMLVLVGCIVPSYSLDFLGIVGLLVRYGQAVVDGTKTFSVFTTIQSLFGQAKLLGGASNYIGLLSLSILLIFSVLVVPILQAMVLMVQWFHPLERKQRYRLSIVLEILSAWQYVEVYLLSLLVAAWQLGPISAFMVNPYCESLQPVFDQLAYYGFLKREDAQCFQSNINVEPTFYILLVAAVILIVVNTFVMHAVSHYFRDLTFDEMERIHALKGHDIEAHSDADRESIHPVPILFTDQFRWVLHREDVALTRRSSSVGDASSPKGSRIAQGTMDDTAQRTFSLENDAVAGDTNNGDCLSPANKTISYSSQDDESSSDYPVPHQETASGRKGNLNSVAFYDDRSAASAVDEFSSHRVIGLSSSSLDGIDFVPMGSQSIAAMDGKSPAALKNPDVSADDIVTVNSIDRSHDVFFQTASWDSFGGPNRHDLRPGLQNGKLGNIESTRSWNESPSKASVFSGNSLLAGRDPSGIMEISKHQDGDGLFRENNRTAPMSVDDYVESDDNDDDASNPGLEGTENASDASEAPSQTVDDEPPIAAASSRDLSIKLSIEDDYMGSFDTNSVQSPRTDLQMS